MFSRIFRPEAIICNLDFWLRGKKESLPIPSYWARMLVCGSIDIPHFLKAGRIGFDCIRDTLARIGRPIETLSDVLDFGCGCGRVLRHWDGLENTRVYGTDINPYLVETCQRSAPFAKISQNSLVAKLEYSDESFDLIYAFSVFTHLDVPAQQEWLQEFRRILRPGGILLLSVHGDAYKPLLTPKELEDFNTGHHVIRLGEYQGANICSTFHPRSFVLDLVKGVFEIADAVPEGAKANPPQDLYALRKL